MTKTSAEEDLFAHIEDLQEHSQLWHTSVCSKFLSVLTLAHTRCGHTKPKNRPKIKNPTDIFLRTDSFPI